MNSMLNYIIEVNLFILIIGLSYRLGFRNNQNYRFGRPFLVLGSLSAFFLPLIDFSSFVENTTAFIGNEHWIETITVQTEVALSYGIQTVLFSLILIGITIKSLLNLIGIFNIAKLKRKSSNTGNYYEVPESWDAFSFFNAVYIGERIEPSKRQMILKHELIHIEKKHFIDLWFTELIKVLFWYNPVVYFIQKDLKELHEFEADEHLNINTKDYINLLLQQNFMLYNYSFINQFNSNHIKNRIMRLKNKEEKPIRIRTIILTTAILIAGIAISQNEIDFKNSSIADLSGLNQLDKLQGLSKLKNLSGLNKLSELNKLSQTKGDEVDQIAEFPGGMSALVEFIGKNVKYPKSSKKDGVEGTVFISFKIDSNGKCEDFIVKKGVNEEIDKAALKAAKAMPNWSPAQKDGKAVASTMVLPVKFALPKEAPEPTTPPAPPAPPAAPEAPKN